MITKSFAANSLLLCSGGFIVSYNLNLISVCKPDVNVNFKRIVKGPNGQPTAVDFSGNNYGIRTENVTFFQGSAYFNGHSKLVIEPLRPSAKDEGVMIIKFKYK